MLCSYLSSHTVSSHFSKRNLIFRRIIIYLLKYNDIVFVFQLKGCNKAHICQEVDLLLQSLGLENVRKLTTDILPGGTKRCLQLALALIGETKVWNSDSYASIRYAATTPRIYILVHRRTLQPTVSNCSTSLCLAYINLKSGLP